eukprot:226830-Amphidinium_carterae.2
MLMTILLCIHYSYIGSTISPLATARQSLASMVTLRQEDDVNHLPGAPGTVPHEEEVENNPLDYNTSDTNSGTGSSLTIGPTIIDDMMKSMWSSLISPQCSPMVHTLLHKSWLILPLDDIRREESTILVREI